MIGSQDILIALALGLIFFGGKKLPELARGLGESLKEFKKATATPDVPPASPPAPPASTAGPHPCPKCQTALQAEWAHCPRCGLELGPAGASAHAESPATHPA